jgi:hypothetical protein
MALDESVHYAQASGMRLNSKVGFLVRNGAALYGFSFAYENVTTLDFIYTIIVLLSLLFLSLETPKQINVQRFEKKF